MVDYFTIPPAIVTLYLDRTWTGLRFLRALHLLSLPAIFQSLSITSKPRKSLKVIATMLAVLGIKLGAFLLFAKW